MRQMKRFRELSRRQKNRRLKQIQFSKNFVTETVNNCINQEANKCVTNFNQKAKLFVLDKKDGNRVSEFVRDNNICSENTGTNKATDQSNADISASFTFSETEHLISNKRQISLREKLILWTDKHKIEQKGLTSLLHILKSEGHDNLPNDGRTLMKTPRCTILYKRSGGYYYHYGLQNGIIDQLKQKSMLIRNNVIQIDVNIDGLPTSKSSKSQLWPILIQIVSENSVPFLVGAYHGYNKPTVDNNFLQHFVTEFKHLSTVGFV